MNADALALYSRLTRVIRDLRSSRGALHDASQPPGAISRDLIATRLIDEIAGWCETLEPEKPIPTPENNVPDATE